VAAVFFHLKPAHIAPAFVLSMVAGVLLTAVGMMIDLARPLLDWTNPQKAIKQNLNVLLALLADVGILTAVFFGVKALIKARFGTNVVLGIVFVGMTALAAASYRTLLNFADRRYPQIE
jgi:ABC-2 type transport system permease protein